MFQIESFIYFRITFGKVSYDVRRVTVQTFQTVLWSFLRLPFLAHLFHTCLRFGNLN